jgi:hypothetical protein
MNKQQYLTSLKKHLHKLDRKSRKDILQEIESLIIDSGCPGVEIAGRFGSPQELANQYLEQAPAKQPGILARLGMGALGFFGAIVILLIVIGLIITWSISTDDFNYADENNAALDLNSSDWKSVSWDGPVSLSIEQAQVVIYWHDKSTLAWNCGLATTPRAAQPLVLHHKQCLLFLPQTELVMKSNQAEVVLVRPSSDINADIYQTSMRIAPNGSRFKIQAEKSENNIDSIPSYPNAEYLVKIDAKQSQVSPYEY